MRSLPDYIERETCRQALDLLGFCPLFPLFLASLPHITVLFLAKNSLATAWEAALRHIANFQGGAVKPPVEPGMFFKHSNSKMKKIGKIPHFGDGL
jgi:hypothetical protein